MKYNVGDRVRIVDKWVKGACVNSNGKMDKWLGSTMTIRTVFTDTLYFMVEDKAENKGKGWLWSDNEIEGLANECNQKIVITSDGYETLARLYDGNKVVKSAAAKCSPEDEFDFKIGAKIAFERLTAEEKKEEPKNEHKFKVGDRVRRINSPVLNFKVGDIGTIVADDKSDIPYGVKSDKDGSTTYNREENLELVKEEFKVGDRVIVKESNIESISQYEGLVGVIKEIWGESYPYKVDCSESGKGCVWCEVERLAPKKEETPHESTDDTEWRVVKRKPKIGDYIRLVNTDFTFDKVGDILKVDSLGIDSTVYVLGKNHKRHTGDPNMLWIYLKNRYEIVERVSEQKPSDKYNGKVVCVESELSFWTVGKVYEFKDGLIFDDEGASRGNNIHFGCFDDFDKWCKQGRRMRFIEVVE